MTDLGFCWFPACGGFPGRMGHGNTAVGLTDPELGVLGVANPLTSSETLDVSRISSSPKLSCFPVCFYQLTPKPVGLL